MNITEALKIAIYTLNTYKKHEASKVLQELKTFLGKA